MFLLTHMFHKPGSESDTNNKSQLQTAEICYIKARSHISVDQKKFEELLKHIFSLDE